MQRPHDFYRRSRSAARRLLVWLAFVPLERLLPIDERVWCFCTWDRYPHTLDNPRAVFEKVKNDPRIKKVVLTRGPAREQQPADGANVRFVEAESILGMYYLARAAVVLLGYGLRAMCSYSKYLTRKHRIIQLWHGIPLKRIGHLFPGEGWWGAETPLYTATISSSPRDHDIMQRAFAPLAQERVWLTGLPRNDFIVGEEAALPDDYKRTLSDLRGRIAGRRFVLYAPTWRDANLVNYSFSKEELADLEALLKVHDAVLGIRGHSNVRDHAAYAGNYGSSVFLNVNELPDVNVALRVTDVLVTDYSSIYIDFLTTRRPVVHFTHDLDEYILQRGLLYEPEEAFAGPIAHDFAELLTLVAQALNDPDSHMDRRNKAYRLFHLHAGDSAQAVADNIRRLLDAPSGRPMTGAKLGSAESRRVASTQSGFTQLSSHL